MHRIDDKAARGAGGENNVSIYMNSMSPVIINVFVLHNLVPHACFQEGSHNWRLLCNPSRRTVSYVVMILLYKAIEASQLKAISRTLCYLYHWTNRIARCGGSNIQVASSAQLDDRIKSK